MQLPCFVLHHPKFEWLKMPTALSSTFVAFVHQDFNTIMYLVSITPMDGYTCRRLQLLQIDSRNTAFRLCFLDLSARVFSNLNYTLAATMIESKL